MTMQTMHLPGNEITGLVAKGRFLTLRRRGLQVLGRKGQMKPLRLHDLCLLERLAAGARANEELAHNVAKVAGGNPAQLENFIALLDQAGFIAPVPEVAREPRSRPLDGVEKPAGDTVFEVELPTVLLITSRGFHICNHAGDEVLLLGAAEAFALPFFVTPVKVSQAFTDYSQAAGPAGLDEKSFYELAGRLHGRGVAHEVDLRADDENSLLELGDVLQQQRDQNHLRLAEAVREIRTRDQGSADRINVVPVSFNDLRPPLALGMILAYARDFEKGVLNRTYAFQADWVLDDARLEQLTTRRSVFLFSNYLWSHKGCLEMSRRVKELNPACINIHGGPNTPKYREDVERYFREHPHVDITVRGEGEATTAWILKVLAGSIGDEQVDFSPLTEVPGLSFRQGDRIVHTPNRPQIMDMDSIPSPYLKGLFDAYTKAPPEFAVVETNRGCPYGCTFCDWGSATMSRIRRFDLERVYAELEWCASHGIPTINVADANFGIWERDVAIASKVVELHRRYGYPKVFAVNFAKNKVKYLKQIIEMMIDEGIITSAVLSLQSMDADTLETIDRSNIRVDKYDELAARFRAARLPIHVDIMVGLPGQTPETFRNDLQECIDREVAVNIADTQLLVNSPMNEPAYRERHQIRTTSAGTVISTATFTEEERYEMGGLGEAYKLLDNFGVLRQVSRWVRQQTGMREIDFYARLCEDSRRDPRRWSMIDYTLAIVPNLLAPPGSWRLFIDEVGDYLVQVLGLELDSAMQTVLDVQHALLPARRRVFPCEVALSHDFAAWHRAMLTAKDNGQRKDWTEIVPPLQSFPPAVFRVDDPDGVSVYATGQSVTAYGFGLSWELDAPVARPSNFGRELVESGVLALSRNSAPSRKARVPA